MTAAAIDRCYWTASADPSRSPPLRGEINIDFAIIGGGIVGTIAARLLKDRGHRVALVESGSVGHGVTGRSTAKVTAQHSLFLQRIEKQHGEGAVRAYADANLAGVALVANLVQRHSLSCDFELADSFVYVTKPDEIEQLENERAAAERAGLSMEIVSETGLPYPITAALRLPNQAQFQPVSFVAALAATLPGDGSFVFEGSSAIDWTETEVRTGEGAISARQVIMATHLPLGKVGQFYAQTHPHMHAVMAIPLDSARTPAGMYISADEPKRSLRRHQKANGEAALIITGPTFKHGDAGAEQEAFAELVTFARQHFGYQGGGYRWSNQDYTPRDGLPYVGWSGSVGKSFLIATGFDAWGLSNGAAAGILLADLCEERENPWTRLFDASRHSLAGLGKLASDGAEVAADLVGGHLQSLSGASPATGEGDIINVSGRAAGVYRDSGGCTRAVSAVCTHMGCLLGWNPVDRTWDCSCHGSRFAADGTVVHGPAIKPLGAIDWPGDHKEFEQ